MILLPFTLPNSKAGCSTKDRKPSTDAPDISQKKVYVALWHVTVSGILTFSGMEAIYFFRFCAIHKEHKPLIVLDSAGGIGYLEFQTVLKVMGNSEYFILLDDIHHLKHFRSARDIKTDKSFEILGLEQHHGWMLAHHRPV